MRFLLKIFFYSLLIKLCLSQSNEPNASNIVQLFVDKYAKYVVYVRGSSIIYNAFYVGIILREDIILTIFINELFKSHLRGSAGVRILGKHRDDRAIVLRNVFNLGSNDPEKPQIAVAELEYPLKLNENVSILKLPRQKYRKGDICVTLSWGRKGNLGQLTAHKVIIQDDCGTGIICFDLYLANNSITHCSVYGGGEPIFCSDKLVALTNYQRYCNANTSALATSIYDNLEWIDTTLNELVSEIISTSYKKSSCGNILYQEIFIFYMIYIFVEIIYEIITS